jgi:hypothetical protein
VAAFASKRVPVSVRCFRPASRDQTFQVPEPDIVTVSGGCQRSAVGGKREVVNRISVTVKAPEFATGRVR